MNPKRREKKVRILVRGADPGLRRLVKGLASSALQALGKNGELSVLLTDDSTIRELNRDFRRIDRATDVLSFPMEEPDVLGDIAISIERARVQARELGVSLDEEVSRLLVHGLLHLFGYDHVRGGAQARRMREKEGELSGLLRRRVSPGG